MRGRYFLHVRDGQGRITTTCRACDATRTEWSDRHVDHWQRAHQCADPNPPTTAPTTHPSTGEAP